MSRPGEVNYSRRFNQKILFSGMVYKTISPTDIDGFIEFGNKVYVVFELKYEGVVCGRGQKTAMQRLVDIIPVPAIAIIAEHTQKATQDIVARFAIVREYRYRGYWEKPKWDINLNQIIKWFLSENGLEDYA